MNKIKHNIPIIIAFCLPLLLIGGVAFSIHNPFNSVKTQYDFVYATCDSSSIRYYEVDCIKFLGKAYAVENGVIKAVVNPSVEDLNNNKVLDREEVSFRLFLHDSKENQDKEITIEEAQKLTLNGLATSPDGVSIQRGSYRGDMGILFFGGGYDNALYLVKEDKRERLDLMYSNNDSYYGYSNPENFRFIGWVESK